MKDKFSALLSLALLAGSGVLLLSPARVAHAQVASPRTITIAAKRFAFTPDKVVLKKGEPVKLVITSDDVTHGFFLRPLKIDTDIEPGKTTELVITPDKAGTYTVICDHFCGVGHGNMHMTFEVQE